MTDDFEKRAREAALEYTPRLGASSWDDFEAGAKWARAEMQQACKERLVTIAQKLRRAGAEIPAPENKGTSESALRTGLSLALLLVEDALEEKS